MAVEFGEFIAVDSSPDPQCVLIGGAISIMGRVVDQDDTPLVIADASVITYSIYGPSCYGNDQMPVVEGHDAIALTPADVMFDTLQLDGWDFDATSYNFRAILDRSANELFAEPGRYLIVVEITPPAGQLVVGNWRVEADVGVVF